MSRIIIIRVVSPLLPREEGGEIVSLATKVQSTIMFGLLDPE